MTGFFNQIVVEGISVTNIDFRLTFSNDGVVVGSHFKPPGKFISDTFNILDVKHNIEGLVDCILKRRNVERDVLPLLVVPNEFEGFVQFAFFFLRILDGGDEIFELFAGGWHNHIVFLQISPFLTWLTNLCKACKDLQGAFETRNFAEK